MRKVMFVLGAAVGYVLGARAGREKYDRMRDAVRRFMDNPKVRHGMDSAGHSGRHAAARAAGMVADRAGGRLPDPVTDRLRSVGGNGSGASVQAQGDGQGSEA